jgi:hypothetical protein
MRSECLGPDSVAKEHAAKGRIELTDAEVSDFEQIAKPLEVPIASVVDIVPIIEENKIPERKRFEDFPVEEEERIRQEALARMEKMEKMLKRAVETDSGLKIAVLSSAGAVKGLYDRGLLLEPEISPDRTMISFGDAVAMALIAQKTKTGEMLEGSMGGTVIQVVRDEVNIQLAQRASEESKD